MARHGKQKAKTPKRRKRGNTITKLKKKLDTVFSLYIRLRDADQKGICECITCGERKHFRQMHAGHFLSRRYLATRWDEMNVAAQCPSCNLYHQGRQYEFSKALKLIRGEEVPDQMLEQSKKKIKMDTHKYRELIEYYEAQINVLMPQKG